jgi:hypothetical protein
MNPTFEYSAKELRLIEALSPHIYKLITNNLFNDVPPPRVFEMIIFDLFLEDKKGPAVEALRRAYKAFKKCEVYREIGRASCRERV